MNIIVQNSRKWQETLCPAHTANCTKFYGAICHIPQKNRGPCPYNKDTLPAFLFCGQRTDPQAFLKTVSGAVMTTRVLSATEPVRKALPPTTE